MRASPHRLSPERGDLGVTQMRAAFEQLAERPVRIAQERLPEFLVGHQPANHDLDAALRHRPPPRHKASATPYLISWRR